MSDGINVSGINSKYSESDASSGPKLTFLGRRQLATETFFFGQTFFFGKMWSPMWSSIKFFLRSETQTKILGRQMENSV